MPKFILLDHSLQNLIGHHFEFASHVLTAAEQAGFEPWLLTHRDFRRPAELPAHWNVIPAYEYTTYSHLCYRSDEVPRVKKRRFGMLRHRFGLLARSRHRVRRAKDFARDSANAFAELKLAVGDQVFAPAINEIDLDGLTRFLASFPQADCGDWHGLFHFPIYAGSEPDYPREDLRLAGLRRTYRRAAARISRQKLHLYTMTDKLAIQYERLGIGTFRPLPFPTNPALEALRTHAHHRAPGPLRIAYLGGARAEKGYQHLPPILEKLWLEHVERGRARFIVQSAFDFSALTKGGDALVSEARTALGKLPAEKINLVEGPQDTASYVNLYRQCDIGLLPYDRRRYHARLSAVLVELLTAGVPVVVPAGCWLADQLAEPNREYHLHVRESQPIVGRKTSGKSTLAAVPAGANHLLVLLRWPIGMQLCTGGYAQVKTTCWSADGRMLGSHSAVVGPALPDRLSTALVRLQPGAAEVTVVWRNAYGAQPLEFRECELCFLRSDPARPLPLGAVGLAAATQNQMAEMLDDMIRHHAHYRSTALKFAPHWTEWHNPQRVVSELLARASNVPLEADLGQSKALSKPHYLSHTAIAQLAANEKALQS